MRSLAARNAGPSKFRRHRPVERIARILPVDDFGHAPQGLHHLILRHDAVMQPVGDVLAGDAQASRDPPSGRHRECPAPSNSRRPGRSSAPHSRGCPGNCCRVPAAPHRAPSSIATPESSGCRRASRAGAASVRPAAPARRPDGSAARASVAAVGEGTQAVFAPAIGWPIFCAIMSAILSGAAHMPLPICALPGRPQARPASTLASSYALIHGVAFMSFLRTMGPASIEVWISSPVRSRKPVLMKTIRSPAARMHALRFTVVRRSSSMMPIFRCCAAGRACPRRAAKRSLANATSSGPCIFGLTI